MANEFQQFDMIKGIVRDSVAVGGMEKDSTDCGAILSRNDSSTYQMPVADMYQLQYPFTETSGYTVCENLKEKSFTSIIPSKEGEPRKTLIQQQVWFMPLMLLLFFLYGWVTSSFSKVLSQEFKDFFYPKSRNDVYDASMGDVSKMKVLLHSLSILSVTIFCYFVFTGLFHHHSNSFILSSLMLLLIIVLFIAFKLLIGRLMCYVFFDKNVLKNLKRTCSSLFSMLAMTLFCVDIVAAYAPEMIAVIALYVGLGVCIVALLLYLFKILSIFFTGISSIFYLILYLCTLEILPSIILVMGLMSVV